MIGPVGRPRPEPANAATGGPAHRAVPAATADPPAGAPLLAVEGLCKGFGGVRAVDDVHLRVAAGELLALIGPNGAGKSTCFNCINGQLRPDAGRIRLGGADIAGLAPRRVWRHGVGRTFQIAATWASMTVAENVQLALLSEAGLLHRAWGRASSLKRAEAVGLLDAVGLADLADEPCAALAYGDVKRVELAMALSNRPRLLLMDEPTAGMAPRERTELVALVRRLVRERGIGVLFTEHSMDVVFEFADRIVVLARGRVLAEGPPASIRDDPVVREVYLGSAALRPAQAPERHG